MPLTRRDVLPAVVLTAAALIEVMLWAPHAVSAVAAMSVLALAARRRHPVAAVAVIGAALVADALAGGALVAELHLSLAVMAFACLAVGLHCASLARTAAGAAIAIAAMTVANQLAPALDYPPLDDLVFFALLLGTPAALGHLLRRRAELIAELAARADALRAAREDAAAAAVAEERARLAIGVHDALAHRVGEMTLQAAGARRVAGDEPGRALAALGHIETAARGALDEIRAVIGVLRAGDELALGPTHLPDRVPGPWERPAREPAALVAPRAPRDRHADALLAAALFVAFSVEIVTSARLEGPPVLNVLGCAAVAAPFVWRRRAPLASTAAAFAAAGVLSWLLTPFELLVTPIALLLVPAYTVGAELPLRRSLAGLAIVAAGTLVVGPAVPAVVIALLAFVAGRAVHERARRVAELHDIAAELARTRDAHAARARGEERLRIARELHDAVAHSMTVIVLQAAAAQRVWGRNPAAARVAVDALTDVARETLTDLRTTLGDAAPTRLDQLDELVARMRPLGVDIVVAREIDALPDDLDHRVFAVIQEAVTNAARHAAPTSVEVAIRRDGEELVVAVTDAGRRPGDAPAVSVEGTGTGLLGMAERVAAAGGRLSYGDQGPGFRVEARMPLDLAAVP